MSAAEEGTPAAAGGSRPMTQQDSPLGLLDLAFAMDCTGSMTPYIINAQQSIRHIVEAIVSAEKSDIHLALVEYRDHPPQEPSYVTRVHDFTDSVGRMKTDLDACSAAGGGDHPEAVADALHQVSNLSWRREATKICVFIADAPPHGIGCYGDGFPNGCPDDLDPMEITQTLAQMGVTMYMVGCEPCIGSYRHFFMGLAHNTGGQYVPLSNADLLSQVIIGGAQEEISLDRLLSVAETEVEHEVSEAGGWDAVGDEFLSHRIMDKMNTKSHSGGHFKIHQLRNKSSALPEASAAAKKLADLKNMAEIRAEYEADTSLGGEDLLLRCENDGLPTTNISSGTKSMKKKKKKKGGSFLCRLFRRGSWRGATAAAPTSTPPIASDSLTPEQDSMDEDDYNVAETMELDLQQARRMVTKMKNKNVK